MHARMRCRNRREFASVRTTICCEPDARGSCAPVGRESEPAVAGPQALERASMRLWKGGESTYGAKMYHSHPELFFDLAVLTHAHVTRRTPARR